MFLIFRHGFSVITKHEFLKHNIQITIELSMCRIFHICKYKKIPEFAYRLNRNTFFIIAAVKHVTTYYKTLGNAKMFKNAF